MPSDDAVTLRSSTVAAPVPADRRLSGILFRYILRDFLLILACAIGAFLILFLIGALFDDLEDFRKHAAPALQTVRYFALLMPAQVLDVLPMSLLLATMYTVARLCHNNEMTAIRSAGLSVVQACRPLLLVGILATIAHALIAEFVVPAANRTSIAVKRTYAEVGTLLERLERPYLAFRNPDERRDWLFRNFRERGTSEDVQVTQFRADGTMAWQLRAATATPGDGVWTFGKAVMTRFDEAGEFTTGPAVRSATLALELTEDPERIGFLFRLRPATDLSARRMFTVVREHGRQLSPATLAVLRTSLWFRLCFPLSCIVTVLVGAPLAVTRQRGSAMRSFVLAAALMAAYYMVAQFFVVLGKNQTVPPVIAGALPSLAATSWGIWLLRRTHT